MARHSSGKSSFQLAGWVWVVLITFIAVAALVFGWQKIAADNQAEVNTPACAEGDYTLEAWTAPEREAAAKQFAEKYNASNRVVRDKCTSISFTQASDADVKSKLQNPRNVAAWLPADTDGAITAANRAGMHVGDGDMAKIGGGSLLLLSAGDRIDEQARRAAQDFEQFALDNGADSVSATTPTQAPPEPHETPESRATPEPRKAPASAPRDVTFVLDTSGSMTLVEGSATRLNNIRGPLAQAMQGVGQRGGAVALWNYSSPLSEGARTPFRNNVDITNRDDGAIAVAILNQLGARGGTHTYESIAAAYASAVAGAGDSKAQTPARVILITDGPNDGGRLTLDTAAAQIRALHGKAPVRLDVVAIGPNVERPAMETIAGAAGGKVHYSPDSLQFDRALTAALR